mgnify:CR=1 FL=1
MTRIFGCLRITLSHHVSCVRTDEVVMQENDEGEEMFFIVAGTVEVVVNLKGASKVGKTNDRPGEKRVAVLIEKQ